MDLLDVMQPFFDFLTRFFSISVTLGGYSFSVGSFMLFVILGGIVIGFLKGIGY